MSSTKEKREQLELAQQVAALRQQEVRGELELMGISDQKIQKNVQYLKLQKEVQQAAVSLAKLQEDADLASISALQKKVQETDELIRKTEQQASAIGTVASNVRGALGIQEKWRQNAVLGLASMISYTGNLSGAFQMMARETDGLIGRSDLLASTYLKIQEVGTAAFSAMFAQTKKLYMAVDEAEVSFNRTTGAAQRFTAAIPRLEAELNKLGVSAEVAGAAMGALYSNTSGFSRMAESTRDAIAATAAIMIKSGTSAETFAANFEMLTMTMGHSGTAAANINAELFNFAQRNEISTNRMLEGFQTAGPQIVKYGSQAVNVYKQLALASKNTGMEVGKLLSLTSKFDTFDTAAQSVGHLNAILGGPFLNTMQMVMTTNPAERMQALAEATRQAGKSFDQLAYYERLALQQALGLESVNDLALIMKGRFDMVGDSTQKTANEIIKIRRETMRYNTVADEFQQIMRQVATSMGPTIHRIKEWMATAQDLAGTINKVVHALVILRGVMLTMQFAAMTAQIYAAAGAMGVLAGAALPLTAALGGLYYIMHEKRNSPTLFETFDLMPNRLTTLGRSFQQLGAQTESIQRVTNSFGQLAYAMNSVPKETTATFTQFIKEVKDLGARAEASNIASVGNLAYATAGGGRRAPSQTHHQPLDVNLYVGKDRFFRETLTSTWTQG